MGGLVCGSVGASVGEPLGICGCVGVSVSACVGL